MFDLDGTNEPQGARGFDPCKATWLVVGLGIAYLVAVCVWPVCGK